MSTQTRNPAALSQGRAGNGIRSFEALDISSNSANLTYSQAYVAQRYRVQPHLARLICDWANLGGRAR